MSCCEVERERLDIPFLRDMSSSPYLVGTARLFPARCRLAQTLGLDTRSGSAQPHDAAGIEACAGRAVLNLQVWWKLVRMNSAGTTPVWSARPRFPSLWRTCASTPRSGRRRCGDVPAAKIREVAGICEARPA